MLLCDAVGSQSHTTVEKSDRPKDFSGWVCYCITVIQCNKHVDKIIACGCMSLSEACLLGCETEKVLKCTQETKPLLCLPVEKVGI